MGGWILCHVDCTSPYSYFALTHLQRIRPVLATYNVTVEFIPVYLGGIMRATDNKPPGALPARGKYLYEDLLRGSEYYDTQSVHPPEFFPIQSINAQRTMCHIKAHYSEDMFEALYKRLWESVFMKHINLEDVSKLEQALTDSSDGRDKCLTQAQADEAIEAAKTSEVKEKLMENTRKAIECYGAFGAPWLWVYTDRDGGNGKNKDGEAIFGSDRWTYIYRILGMDFEDVKIKEASKL